jgi:hypothetical protein
MNVDESSDSDHTNQFVTLTQGINHHSLCGTTLEGMQFGPAILTTNITFQSEVSGPVSVLMLPEDVMAWS